MDRHIPIPMSREEGHNSEEPPHSAAVWRCSRCHATWEAADQFCPGCYPQRHDVVLEQASWEKDLFA